MDPDIYTPRHLHGQVAPVSGNITFCCHPYSLLNISLDISHEGCVYGTHIQ